MNHQITNEPARYHILISNLPFGQAHGHVVGLGHVYKSLEGQQTANKGKYRAKPGQLKRIKKCYMIKEVTGLAVPIIPMRETVAPNSSFA